MGTIPRVALGLCLAVGVSCESTPAGPDTDPDQALPLRPRFPVDGRATFEGVPLRFDGSATWVTSDGSPSGETTVRVLQRNDDVDLYVAIEWSDGTRDDGSSAADPAFDAAHLVFDSNGDGAFGTGDDVRTAVSAHQGSLYFDGHIDGAAAGATWAKDLTGDGLGRLAHDPGSGRYIAEFLITLAPDRAGEDAALGGQTPFAIRLSDREPGHPGLNMGPEQPLPLGTPTRSTSPLGDTELGASTAGWPRLDLAPTPALSRPGLPDDLRGLIALVSTHEGSRGLYLFRPSSGDLQRVPVDPLLHIEHIALSNDWNWVLLQATPTPEDRDSYEIYRVATDGTRLSQLTDNAVWDGTPSWSLNDDRVVYVSERDTNVEGRRQGSIIVMTPEGVELDDLTSDPVDDRDPIFLNDSRIAMKTTRASPWPRYRIGAVRESGAAFDILTEALGGTDHHPGARGDWIYYERFRADGDYRTHPEVRAAAWDVMSVHRLGGQGSTLVTDGWANRLPVPDPSGRYVAYLRQSGHSYLELVTVDGTFLGRLLPDVTEVEQVDWR